MKTPALYLSLILAAGSAASAGAMKIPALIHHQGRLVDAAGQPVTGLVDLVFRLYDAPTGGAPLWEETHVGVPVDDGLFSVTLGSLDPLSPAALADSAGGTLERYLEIQVGDAGPPLVPRTQLVAAPYAVAAHRLAGDLQSMAGKLQLMVPPPDDIRVGLELSTDTAGSALRVMAFPPDPIMPAATLRAGTAGSALELRDQWPAAGGLADSGTGRITVDPTGGAVLQLDLHVSGGIQPCVRVATDAAGASLHMSRTLPSGPTAASPPLGHAAAPAATDSVSIAMTVDSDRAELQLYAGGSAAETPIVMSADGVEARVGINTLSPKAALDVSGDICVSGSVGACSDLRYKREVEQIEGALDKLSNLRGVEFRWRQAEFAERRFADGPQVGVVAQEVEEVLPMLVSTREDGYKAVDYGKLSAILIEAVKELKAENAELRQRLERVERKTL